MLRQKMKVQMDRRRPLMILLAALLAIVALLSIGPIRKEFSESMEKTRIGLEKISGSTDVKNHQSDLETLGGMRGPDGLYHAQRD